MTDTPVFVDLQGFTVNGKFTVKEFTVLRSGGRELIHYIFRSPLAWNLLTASDKSQACWLTANHHGLRWDDGYVEYAMAKTLMRNALPDEPETRVYVKGLEKKKWLIEIAGNATQLFFANIDDDYDDVGQLRHISADQTLRCGRHEKTCAMENVLKLSRWWRERRERLKNGCTYRSPMVTLTTAYRSPTNENYNEDNDDDDEENKVTDGTYL